MVSLKRDEKSQSEILSKKDTGDQQQMLLDCGYSEKAIRYPRCWDPAGTP